MNTIQLLKKLRITLMVLLTFGICSCSSETEETLSPNKNISISIQIDEQDNGYGEVFFQVNYKNSNVVQTILPKVCLGVETDRQNFRNLKLTKVSDIKLIEDNYQMITGKRSHCVNTANERVFQFENEQQQTIKVAFRVYNDGVTFRYAFDEVPTDVAHITNELTAYSIPEGTKRWMQSYSIGYEGFYPQRTHGEAESENPSHMWGYPALIEPEDSLFVLITEANIMRNHCGSKLYNGEKPDSYQVRLSDKEQAIHSSWVSPWRVLIIGSLADVVSSTLVTDVSEPCKVENTSWIVPAPVAWIYWAHNHSSNDFKIVKEYIDLAADMGWSYDLIDWKWDGMGNGGNIEDAIKYAQGKGVKPMLWYNSGTAWIGGGAPGPIDRLNNKENREKEYAWLNNLGVSGVKIDFFGDDSADMMNYYIDLLEDAVKYQLMINFHGATIPRGWQRTYPHMMTVEGVYGAEWYNNKPILTDRAAAHNATLPFTRNVVGPMDYTPGTFTDSQHPHITSHGHELALPVIFESALQHMPDRPSAYYSLPKAIKTFLSELPTAWDDTKLLKGYPGTEVILARRKGNVWYIGGINGTDNARTLRFNPAILANAGKTITLFKDGENNRTFSIEENLRITDLEAEISIECLPGGGFVAIIK